LFLTNFAEKVYLIHRREALRADHINQGRLFAHPKIEILWNSAVAEVHGAADPLGVTHVDLLDLPTGVLRKLPIHGLFVAIGHSPATSLFAGQLDQDEDGYLLTAANSTATSVAGVFAAGDVRDKIYRQAVTAAGSGCMAALEAERWLAEIGLAERAVAAE
jgi:thioredoxin reductase (NADPH)